MRIAIISDIHGNLVALEAVVKRLGGVDVLLCPGDLVGYGPWPNECCEMVRSLGAVCVAGNHDRAATDQLDPDDFNPAARLAVLWTREQVTEETRNFLTALPDDTVHEGITLMHGSLPDRDAYVFSLTGARVSVALMKTDVGFFGHTHLPAAYSSAIDEKPEGARDVREEVWPVSLEAGRRYLLNPGSVGQPRDSDPRAAFAIYDTDAKRAELHREPYDIEKVQEVMLEVRLPASLAARLSFGW